MKDDVLFSNDYKSLFYYPQWLKNENYVIPEGVETIGEDAFSSSHILSSFEFPETLKTISSKAFYGNQYLKKIIIPESVEMVGSYTFSYNTNLEEVIISSKNIQIKESCFLGCKKLNKVIITSESIDINDNVFSNCSKSLSVHVLHTNQIEIEGITVSKDMNKYSCGDKCSSFYNIEDKIITLKGNGMIENTEGITEDEKKLVKEIHIDKKFTSISSNLLNQFINIQKVKYDSTTDFTSCSKSVFPNTITTIEVPIEYSK